MPNKRLQLHQRAWLQAHPERSAEWLRRILDEGFQVHHVDGNHANNNPDNLKLMEATDHMRLHGLFRLKPYDSKHLSEAGRKGAIIRNAKRRRYQAMAAKALAARWKNHVIAVTPKNRKKYERKGGKLCKSCEINWAINSTDFCLRCEPVHG